MTLRSGVLLAALLASAAVSAKDHVTCSHARQKQIIAALPDFPKRPYDISTYNLTLDIRQAFYTKQPVFSGKAEIKLTTTDNTQSIEFDAAFMVMTRVLVNGEEMLPTPQPLNKVLTLPLAPGQQASGTELNITIEYERSNTENLGAYFYPKGHFVGLGPKPAEDSVIVEEDLFYTMSEPFDARYWMPCNDHPHEKMDAGITVIVPSGITVTSNGELVSMLPGGATDIWSYKSDRPITSYLMVVNASTFSSWEEHVARVHDPADSIPLSYHVWPQDYGQDSITDGSKYNAKNAFRNTPNIMRAFENRFGPYPFKRYGQTAVQPIDIGGMEHQSMTTVNRLWLRGFHEGGIAHEVGHQWFGDKVTCETFKDLWLNEGFATYSEAIYAESWGNYEWYMWSVLAKARAYFEGPNHQMRNDFPIYDPPNGELFSQPITYYKSSVVIHQLRRLVNNDSLFFAAIRQYLDDFAYGNANTQTFKNSMSQALGIDLDEFFDQWIFGAKHPEFWVLWDQNDDNRTYLRINQIQTVRDHFTMPIRFFAYHGSKIDTIGITVANRTESWNGFVNGKIDSLIFDKDFGALSMNSVEFDASLSVDEAVTAMFITLDPRTQELLCKSPTDFTVEVYDALGKQVLRSHSFTGVQTLSTESLANGVYVVRMNAGGKTTARTIPIVR